jgi:hypothetical protein
LGNRAPAVSTTHFGRNIDRDTCDRIKPETITAYNNSKSDVDKVGEMIDKYNLSRSVRGGHSKFFHFTDIACLNDNVTFLLNNPNEKSKSIFIKNLG